MPDQRINRKVAFFQISVGTGIPTIYLSLRLVVRSGLLDIYPFQ